MVLVDSVGCHCLSDSVPHLSVSPPPPPPPPPHTPQKKKMAGALNTHSECPSNCTALFLEALQTALHCVPRRLRVWEWRLISLNNTEERLNISEGHCGLDLPGVWGLSRDLILNWRSSINLRPSMQSLQIRYTHIKSNYLVMELPLLQNHFSVYMFHLQ